MVRRSAATHMAVSIINQNFIKVIPPQSIITDILPLYNTMAQDEQDSVRLLTVEDFIVMAQQLKPEGVRKHLLNTLKVSCSDSSWRVRYMIADKFVQVFTIN